MKRYLFIQSQDPFTSRNAERHYALAKALGRAGNTVRMLLVQNGVTIACESTTNTAFGQMLAAGVAVYADSYALSEREIAAGELRTGIDVANLDLVVQALLAGDNVIWH
jgi:sulfur relay (sulfurtransferase) complex TusBCD TusD component (DsrE family)